MLKKSKKLTTILIIIACFAVVYSVKAFTGSSTKNISAGTHAKIKGDRDAPLKIIEFIDFQCPACARGAKYLKEQMRRNPKLIRLELKHYPLVTHSHGNLSAQYAECAANQGKFWPLHDLLLARQNNWKRLADAQPAFDQMVVDAELNSQEMKACLESGGADKMIEKNQLDGKARGVRSTPTYFVNGKIIVGKKSLELEIAKYLEANSH